MSGSTPKRPAPPRPSPGSKTSEKQNSDNQKKTTRWDLFTQPIEVFDFFFCPKLPTLPDVVQFDVSSSILPVWVHVIVHLDGIGVHTEPVSSRVHHYDKRLLSWWSWCHLKAHGAPCEKFNYYIYVCITETVADKSKVSGSGSGLWARLVQAMQSIPECLFKVSLWKQNYCFSKLFGYYSCMTILPIYTTSKNVKKKLWEASKVDSSISSHRMIEFFSSLHSQNCTIVRSNQILC